MHIAIAGNIGSGKSTACKIFKENGFKVINADIVGHEILKREEVKEKIVNNQKDRVEYGFW